MKISFISLGCSKNRVDSEFIMGMLKTSQHVIIENHALADAIFINTCGFITPAKQEAIDTILDMSEIKAKTNAKLIVLGCLAQRYKSQLITELPEVDRFISLDEYDRLDDILSYELSIPVQTKYKQVPRFHSVEPYLGYLKISEGCSNQCSFCAIPLIRGQYHSYPMEELIEQAKIMAKNGVRECVIVAQDTTMYGMDIYQKQALVELVKAINEIDQIKWIRVLYMYPDLLSKAMIEQLATIEKFVPYFDIPIQHTEDKLLKDMKRRGNSQQIIDIMDTIRHTFNDAIIRTTLIVGYPTETDDDFNSMLTFIKKHPFDRLGAFTFSKEEDTVAYQLEDLSETVKQQRYDQLMIAQSHVIKDNQQSFIQRTLEVVVEKVDTITKTAKTRSQYHAPDDIDGFVYVSLLELVEVGQFIECVVESFYGNNWYATQIIKEDA
jgi:ribosomal protein S12 methylthiotransferase